MKYISQYFVISVFVIYFVVMYFQTPHNKANGGHIEWTNWLSISKYRKKYNEAVHNKLFVKYFSFLRIEAFFLTSEQQSRFY